HRRTFDDVRRSRVEHGCSAAPSFTYPMDQELSSSTAIRNCIRLGRGSWPMPSAVWSGHLHFGLVAMPVRLLVAARTKTRRFRRLYRKQVNESPFITSSPSFS